MNHTLQKEKVEEAMDDAKSFSTNQRNQKGKSRIFWLIAIIFTIILSAVLQYSKEQELELNQLQAKLEESIPLKDYGKARYCELLEKVKGTVLCACKSNFIRKIGSLTGYKVSENDIYQTPIETSHKDFFGIAFGIDRTLICY